MARLAVLVICLVLIFEANFVTSFIELLRHNIALDNVGRLPEDLQVSPKAQFLYPLTKEWETVKSSPKSEKSCKFGQRGNGDTVLASESNSWSWPNARNVKLALPFPGVKNTIVTYAEINYEEGSNEDRCYIVEGNIGQNQLTILIEANQTKYFSFEARIYGEE